MEGSSSRSKPILLIQSLGIGRQPRYFRLVGIDIASGIATFLCRNAVMADKAR